MKILIVLLLFLYGNVEIQCQNVLIKGQVLDKQTGEALLGANIILINTQYGSATNVNGHYELIIPLNAIELSKCELKANYIGYKGLQFNTNLSLCNFHKIDFLLEYTGNFNSTTEIVERYETLNLVDYSILGIYLLTMFLILKNNIRSVRSKK